MNATGLRRSGMLGTIASAALLIAGAGSPGAAQAAPSCSFEGPPANLLSITTTGGLTGGAQIHVRDADILVRGDSGRALRCDGGDPTVLNTDAISVRARGAISFFDIALGGGQLAPGATLETEGASEIEVQVDGAGALVTVSGTAGADWYSWVSEGPLVGLNVDPGATGDEDADVIVTDRDAATFAAGMGGPDRITADPGAVGNNDLVFAEGGPGDDQLAATGSGTSLFGGPGNDRLVGSRGVDWLSGGAGRDDLIGDSGADLLEPGTGRDVVRADAGRDVVKARDATGDRVSCGAGGDRVIADSADELRGCERVRRR